MTAAVVVVSVRYPFVFKKILFQLHWLLGISAGLVLALMGVTGATMSFEDEISEALSPRLYAPGVPAGPDLSPDQLIARVQADHPGYYIARLDWEMARDRSHSVRLSSSEGRGRKQGQVDRATGAWLGAPAGEGFFHLMDDLHRWLALPGGGNGIGRQITAFSAISLIFFALSGLYLRWPRQALDWRAWLVLDLRGVSMIDATGGSLSAFAQDSTNPLVYTALFTPDANGVGVATVGVASGKFTDAAGNINQDGGQDNNKALISVNTQAPTISALAIQTGFAATSVKFMFTMSRKPS